MYVLMKQVVQIVTVRPLRFPESYLTATEDISLHGCFALNLT